FKSGSSTSPAITMTPRLDAPGLFVGGAFGAIYGKRSVGVGLYTVPSELFADGFESGDVSAWSFLVD
ncbi:MAG: hypothetical protein AAFY88_07335, partial [Acidobacteriota bacterium]